MAELNFNMLNNIPAGIAGGYQQGYAFGSEVKKQRQAEADQNALRANAAGVIAGDPTAYANSVAIDPTVANAQDAAGSNLAQRASNLAEYILGGRTPEEKAARYKSGLPTLAKFAPPGQTPAPDYSPEMDPLMQQLVTTYKGRGSAKTGNVFAQKIGEDGFIYNFLQDGTSVNTGIKANPNTQFLEGQGGYYLGNKTTGTAAPVMLGGQSAAPRAGVAPSAPAPAPPAGMSQIQYATDDGAPIPPEDYAIAQAAFRADAAGQQFNMPAGGAPASTPQALPPALDYANGGQIGQQLRPADKTASPIEQERLRLAQDANARAQEASQRAAQAAENAQRGNAPAGFRFRSDNTLEPIPGGPKPAGAAASEDERKAAGWLNQSRKAFSDMEAALALDPEADTPGIIETYVPNDEVANRSRNAARQKYVQASSSFSEAALRAATGAGVNESEAKQKIRELTPARGDTDEVKAQKRASLLNYLDSFQQRAGRAAPQGEAAGGNQFQNTAPVVDGPRVASRQRAKNPETGQVLELINGAWVPAQ